MTDVGLGGFAARSGFTEGGVYSSVSMGYCPPSSNGTGYGVVVQAYGAISGRGATRTCTMYVGGAAVGLTRGSAGSAQDTGWVGTSYWTFPSGYGTSYGYTSLSGSCYFARSATSGPVGSYGAYGNFTGYLGMYYTYYYNPSQPRTVTVTPNVDGDEATVAWLAPSDNGGTPVTGYRVQRDTVSTFDSPNLATVAVVGTSTLMTGLTPGQTYYYRVTARNYVTDAVGVLGGAWSSTITQVQPEANGLGRQYRGGIFTANDANVWNGTSWVDAEMRVANGGLAWVEAGG